MDGIFEFLQRAEHAALEPFLGKICEEALDGIEPGGRCRGEVEDEAWMFGDPFQDVGVLVSGSGCTAAWHVGGDDPTR